MPHVIEAAPTGRSKCRGCGAAIAAKTLRFGETVENQFAGGETFQWYHLDCGAFKRPHPFLQTLEAAEAVEGAEALAAAARAGVEHERLTRINGAEHDPSGRAVCRHCKTIIAKGAWRVPLVFYEEGRFSAAGFLHAPCLRPYVEADDVMPRVRHFAPALTDADAAAIADELQKPAPTLPPA